MYFNISSSRSIFKCITYFSKSLENFRNWTWSNSFEFGLAKLEMDLKYFYNTRETYIFDSLFSTLFPLLLQNVDVSIKQISPILFSQFLNSIVADIFFTITLHLEIEQGSERIYLINPRSCPIRDRLFFRRHGRNGKTKMVPLSVSDTVGTIL